VVLRTRKRLTPKDVAAVKGLIIILVTTLKRAVVLCGYRSVRHMRLTVRLPRMRSKNKALFLRQTHALNAAASALSFFLSWRYSEHHIRQYTCYFMKISANIELQVYSMANCLQIFAITAAII
jgi:hypothetical protein